MSEHPVLKEAVARYEEVFGKSPVVRAFAPGRVNLIGKEYIESNICVWSDQDLPF